MSNPIPVWEHPLSIWRTKSEYFIWLRGHLRRIWADFPLRSEWKKSQLRPVTKEERLKKVFHPSTKTVGQCYLCKGWFAGSKLECDHIQASEGCYDFDTASKFLWHCAADDPSNWALVCQPCHKIKSYAERHNMSFEAAKKEKAVIEKINQTVAIQKKELLAAGFKAQDISNEDKRREAYRKLLGEKE